MERLSEHGKPLDSNVIQEEHMPGNVEGFTSVSGNLQDTKYYQQ